MPATRSVPAVGRVSVAIVRISVVLPAPLGPSTASTWPDGHGEIQAGERLDVAEVLLEPFGLDHHVHRVKLPNRAHSKAKLRVRARRGRVPT